jgi:hypothetical protein
VGDMNSPIKYEEKQDWGNEAIPPILAKCLGVTVFLFSLLYLWKLHARHVAMAWQGCMAALAAALLIILVAHFAMTVTTSKKFWALYTLIFLLIVVLGLLAL